jgi:hypothetical protein
MTKRPWVLAVYARGTRSDRDGVRNPYDAREFRLAPDETSALREATSLRARGFPVDVLAVRMSSFP